MFPPVAQIPDDDTLPPVKFGRPIRLPQSAWQRAFAGLCLFLWLNLLLSAVLPVFHRHAHADASSPTHQCAVTAVQQGKVAFHAPAPVVAVAPPTHVLETAQAISVSLPNFFYLLSPGRAPPVV